MPTALREQGFEFFFYSNERNEPAHIHVLGAAWRCEILVEAGLAGVIPRAAQS